jgi:hypothetical protein
MSTETQTPETKVDPQPTAAATAAANAPFRPDSAATVWQCFVYLLTVGSALGLGFVVATIIAIAEGWIDLSFC